MPVSSILLWTSTLCLSNTVSPLRLPGVKDVCVFNSNLSPSSLAEWPGSFTRWAVSRGWIGYRFQHSARYSHVVDVHWCLHCIDLLNVSSGSPSRGGDVAVYVFDINQPSLPTPFSSVVVSVSVFMALSTLFHFINFPPKLPACSLSSFGLISALLVLSTIHLFMKVSPNLVYNPLWLTGLKAPTN